VEISWRYPEFIRHNVLHIFSFREDDKKATIKDINKKEKTNSKACVILT